MVGQARNGEAVTSAAPKARRSERGARAAAGEDVRIRRRGQPAVRLVPEEPSPVPFDWDALRAFTDTLPLDTSESVLTLRRQARY